VSTYSGEKAHSAPMGVSTPDLECLCVETYKGSETCSNIAVKKAFAVNLSSDVSLFCDSYFRRDSIAYVRAACIDAPVIARADASLEVSVDRCEDLGDRYRFTGRVAGYSLKNGSSRVCLVNRGEWLVLEALIALSKIPSASLEEKALLSGEVRRICRVVSRVAPGSELEHLASDLSSRL